MIFAKALGVVMKCNHTCSNCQKVMNGMIGNGAPEKGDITVCGNCGFIGQFDENMNIIAVDTDHYSKLDKEVRAAIEEDAYNIRISKYLEGINASQISEKGGRA